MTTKTGMNNRMNKNILPSLSGNKKGVSGFLVWAILFLILAVVSGIFGFGFISGVSFAIAKWLAIIFVILFVISVVAHVIKNA